MARLARVVIPGLPHHITQRGNRRQQTFFNDGDYAEYLAKVSPLLKMARNWRRLLTSAVTEEEIEVFRQHERTGRVLGDEDFQKRLEKNLGRILRRRKPGPKRTSTR